MFLSADLHSATFHDAAFHTAAQHGTSLLASTSGQQIAYDGGSGSGFPSIFVFVLAIGVLLILTFLRREATVVVVQQPVGSIISIFGLVVIGVAVLIVVLHLMSGSA